MAATLLKNEINLFANEGRHSMCNIEMDQVSTSGNPHCHSHLKNSETQQATQKTFIQKQIDEEKHGSAVSIDARSFAGQSDVQPLTDIHICRYEECVKFHRRPEDKNSPESPYSPLKNAFLYLVIIMLVVWIIIYAILSQMNLL